jgi:hypothetical protein
MTIKILSEHLEYYPTTGELFWKKSPGQRVAAGTQAGSIDSSGQRQIKFKGKTYQASHVIWFIVHGHQPQEIDHRDRNPDNNRLENLREVTHRQNCHNRKRENLSGFPGVSKKNSRWQARITIDGKTKRLGTFDTPELAYAAYQMAAENSHMKEYFPDV